MATPKKTDLAALQKNAHMPVKQAGGSTVGDFFKLNKATIEAVLPAHVKADRMLKIALGAIRTTPKLQEATSVSLFGALVTCAQLGLEPNTPNGHAYLIPFRNNQKNTTDVQVIIGYRGLIDLARRSGQIVSIAAHAVHSNDEFSFEYGLDEHLKHIPCIDGERGEITHFYAVAKLVGGGYAFEVMSRSSVEEIRNNSQNWKTAVRFKKEGQSIWTLHFEEMGRKTLIRRLYKYLPTSIEMARASDLDSKSSHGEEQELDQALTGEFSVVDDDAAAGMIASPDGFGGNDPDEIVNPETGEIFDPQKHLSPDKTNQDGSYTKRPHRGKSASNPEPEKTADPLAPYVAAMQRASNVDELSLARELANGPDTGLSNDQLKSLDGFYNSLLVKIANSMPDDDGDPGYGGME